LITVLGCAEGSRRRKVYPPSFNRVIGLKWLAGLFHPDTLAGDLRETAGAFYRLFYHVEPSDAGLELLMAWSKGQAR
jgi:iron complex transport system substrate-binding protein